MIPAVPLILGLAGVAPFVWGVVSMLVPWVGQWGVATFGPLSVGPYVQIIYGTVILSFMSGVLWGFATKAATNAQASICYTLSVLPAIWAWLKTGGDPATSAINLMFGFVGVLLLDIAFSAWGLTPAWWIKLRALLTVLVLGCLSVGILW